MSLVAVGVTVESVYLCEGLSVCILAQSQKQGYCRGGLGGVAGTKAGTGCPQPGGLTGSRHVLSCSVSVASSESVLSLFTTVASQGWGAGGVRLQGTKTARLPPTP